MSSTSFVPLNLSENYVKDSLSMDDLVTKNRRLDQELRELKTILSEVSLTKATVQLRQQIKNQDLNQTWLPSTDDLVFAVTCGKTKLRKLMCLRFCSKIPFSLYEKCGTKNRTRFLDITSHARVGGGSISDALIGMHAFTGCDTVSIFAGCRKLTTFKQMKSNKTFQEAFSELRRSRDISPELFQKLHYVNLPNVHAFCFNN
uniref:Uncharacterized protein n=1 Tax=Octopus bimaculoides TaxID=37653 RepID=A0A0L8FM08_OCTBM